MRPCCLTAACLCMSRSRDWLTDIVLDAISQRQHAGVGRIPIEVHELPHNYVSSEETSLVHWLNGGPTSIPNLVTLCDAHHRAVHELGWKMSGDANEMLSFRSPTGRVTTSTPSPTFTSARAAPPG